MRAKERIDIILDVLDIKQFLLDLGIPVKIADECDLLVIENWEIFVKNWKDYPDERLTQTLINQGFLPNIPGSWYFKEEDDYCIEKGFLKVEEIKFWGTYGKSGKGPFKKVLLKDMSKAHMKAIIKDGYNLFDSYKEYFNSRLNEKPKRKAVKTRSIKSKSRKTSKIRKSVNKTKVKKSLVR